MSDRKTVSEEDWEILNAFADDELSAKARTSVEGRLTREPALAAALGRIVALKVDLRGLKAAPPRRARPRRVALPALAALVLVAALAFAWGPKPPSPGTVAEVHLVLSDMAPGQMPQIDATGALDLSASDLALVGGMVASGPGGPLRAWHYRGRNGCALTLASGTGLEAADRPLSRAWRTGERDYAIVADGMDADRFAAIARYAESRTRRIIDTGQRIALRRITDAAARCS